MCYDISFSTTIEMVTDYIPDLVIDPQIGINYDMTQHLQIRENKNYPVIIMREGRPYLTPMKWGIEVYPGTVSFNSQSEKILQKGSVWYKRRNNRCLIPVTGFFEHREIKGWKKKVPYYISIKGKKLFCLPGLYSDSQKTYSLITRPANELMCQIHNSGDNPFRMPLLLPDRNLELRWLAKDLPEVEMAAILDYELPSEELEYETVYTIRSAKERPDGKTKIDPYAWPNLPHLGQDTSEQTLF
jgi:putative SOS response-associated peptidase YedK